MTVTRNRKSSTDLGGCDDSLKPLDLTPEQEAENARLASRLISRQPDADVLAEMLGLKPYKSGARPQRVPRGDLVHGRRSTYTNHKCSCDDCRRANTEYHNQRSAA